MIVRELVTRFGFAVDTSAQSRVESSIQRISGLLSGIAAFASLRALANVADSMQSLEARIGMLPQTIGDVGAAFNEVSQRATASRQSIDAYGGLYVKLANAGKDYITTQEDALKITDTISKAMVVGGATTAEAGSVMTQFAQAIGSGTLQGDEFRSMAEAAPQYMDALAEALGKPRAELKKLASEGKITTKEVIQATLKMSSLFDEKYRAMPMTIGAATTMIGNRFKTMVQNMNRESQVVSDVANFMIRVFDKIEAGAKSFIEFVGGQSNAIKALGIALAAILGPMALGGLVSILGAVFSIGGLVVAALVLLGLAVDDVMTYLSGGQSMLGDFLQWLKDGSAWASVFEGALIALGAVLSLYVVYLGTLAKAWVMVQVGAIGARVAMVAAWLATLGPMGLVLAGIAAISAALMYVYNNWEKVKGFFGVGGVTAPVTAGSVATAANGGTSSVVNSTQEFNITVPPGTPESQQAFIKDAMQRAASEGPFGKMSRDMSMIGP